MVKYLNICFGLVIISTIWPSVPAIITKKAKVSHSGLSDKFVLIWIKKKIAKMECNLPKGLPFEIELLNSEDISDIKDCLYGYNEYYARIGPKKVLIDGELLPVLPKIYNLQPRFNDTFVVTYPKTGTTLTQELVWLICNDLDYQQAASVILGERFPFLEISELLNLSPLSEDQIAVVKKCVIPVTTAEVDKMPSPRFIKSHLYISLLPPSLLDNAKVVYVARDPRDVAVSYYYHHKLMKMMAPDIEFKQFWKYFMAGLVKYGSYFEHVLDSWEKRNHPNMLYLFYEEIVKDLPKTIQRVAEFFGKTLTEEQVKTLAQHLDFDTFKKNKSVNLEDMQQSGVWSSDGAFIRKGKSGGWRDHFDEEMTAQADEWIASNLRDTDFQLPHC